MRPGLGGDAHQGEPPAVGGAGPRQQMPGVLAGQPQPALAGAGTTPTEFTPAPPVAQPPNGPTGGSLRLRPDRHLVQRLLIEGLGDRRRDPSGPGWPETGVVHADDTATAATTRAMPRTVRPVPSTAAHPSGAPQGRTRHLALRITWAEAHCSAHPRDRLGAPGAGRYVSLSPTGAAGPNHFQRSWMPNECPMYSVARSHGRTVANGHASERRRCSSTTPLSP